jgi:hypothetical protein
MTAVSAIIALCVSLAASFSTAHADKINFGQRSYITGRDNVCKNISNGSPTQLSVFVPIYTLEEWQSFYNRPPSGVELSHCACNAQTLNNCSLPDTVYGSTSSGVCSAGYSGSCSYACNDGVLNPVTNSCAKDCSATTINSCILPTTNSGQTSAGTCSAGASGACSYSCSNGTFSVV